MAPGPADPWWDGAAGYQVYLPSFADGNGDGLGDLVGAHERLDHLAWLGVDVVWLTPFYPSPLADHGYDVVDHRQVDPRFGSLQVLDALVAKAHRLGLRVLVDLVVNHTSWRHPWFVASRAARDAGMRDWYVWRDGRPGGRPPNNWVSAFGGPAWSRDPGTGQWWLHLHLPEQPDLNWANPAVADAVDDVIRFWLDRGVDGFRVDVAHELVKHPDLPDNPPAEPTDGGPREPGTVAAWQAMEHRYDLDQPGVLDLHRRWRRIAEPYGALLLGEVYLLDAERLGRYLRAGDGLHAAFWVQPLALGWSATAIRGSLRSGLDAAPAGTLAWIQGNHDDQSRAATRLGGRGRSLALATLLAGLPGMWFTYQGEELGLEDGAVPGERLQDPLAVRTGDPDLGRDRVRTPMPWQPRPGLGFTTAARPWLPAGGRRAADTVAVQRDDPNSTLHRYRALLAARREHLPATGEPVDWLETGPVVAYRRGDLLVAANLGGEAAAVRPPGRWATVFATAREALAGGALGPGHAVMLRRERA